MLVERHFPLNGLTIERDNFSAKGPLNAVVIQIVKQKLI